MQIDFEQVTDDTRRNVECNGVDTEQSDQTVTLSGLLYTRFMRMRSFPLSHSRMGFVCVLSDSLYENVSYWENTNQCGVLNAIIARVTL